MASTKEDNTKENSYLFRSAFLEPGETKRLDDLHHGFTVYLGGLLPSPLEVSNVKRILELGSGSGAWVIQAASEFPEAEVMAVDLNPLPNRKIPSNITFMQVDLSQSLPFEEESFDIVHARLVLLHLPHGLEMLRQIFKLIKPGGWLLIEEPDDGAMMDGGKPLGPGMAKVMGTWRDMMHSRNADPDIGRRLEGEIKASGSFDLINVKKLAIPISGQSHDPRENCIGAAWKRTLQKVTMDFSERLRAVGITEAIAKRHFEELDDANRSITTDMYITWSRKQVHA